MDYVKFGYPSGLGVICNRKRRYLQRRFSVDQIAEALIHDRRCSKSTWVAIAEKKRGIRGNFDV